MSIKESKASCGGQLSGDLPYVVRPRKAARSRGAHSSEAPRKHQKAGEVEGMEAEAADLTLQVPAKLTIRFEFRMRDIEATMCCAVFLPSESGIVKEVQEAGRDYNNMVTNQPTMERRSPDIRFFSAMMKAIVETLVDKANLSPSDRGKVDDLRLLGQLTEERSSSISASGPNRAGISLRTPGLGRHPKHGSFPRRTGTSRTNGRNRRPTPDTQHTHRLKRPSERKMDTTKRRNKIQDLVRHSLILCGAQVESSAREPGERTQECFFLEKGKGKGKGMPQFSQSSMDLAG